MKIAPADPNEAYRDFITRNDPSNATHCQEVQRHHDAAYAALEKAGRHPLPGRDHWRELYEAEKQAAETSARAHEMGKCSCYLRAKMKAAK